MDMIPSGIRRRGGRTEALFVFHAAGVLQVCFVEQSNAPETPALSMSKYTQWKTSQLLQC